jgi:hypothetical protein
LDFGCGLGYTSKRLREIFAGAEIIGVDTSARNFGAGMVMTRVPFDRDAHMLSPLLTRRLLREEGTGRDGFREAIAESTATYQ